MRKHEHLAGIDSAQFRPAELPRQGNLCLSLHWTRDLMASATREPVIPARWLDRNALADYIQVRVSELPRLGRRGLLPAPSLHLGPRSPRWDRQAVDALFQSTSREGETVVKVDSFFDQVKARWPARN